MTPPSTFSSRTTVSNASRMGRGGPRSLQLTGAVPSCPPDDITALSDAPNREWFRRELVDDWSRVEVSRARSLRLSYVCLLGFPHKPYRFGEVRPGVCVNETHVAVQAARIVLRVSTVGLAAEMRISSWDPDSRKRMGEAQPPAIGGLMNDLSSPVDSSTSICPAPFEQRRHPSQRGRRGTWRRPGMLSGLAERIGILSWPCAPRSRQLSVWEQLIAADVV
ncbi:hypothetical protein C8Q77DRAFT_205509 [Trametes polyzona]|nr:hypothetical protein C8Q77DRAFT_205509 [Trametes polyzona]